MHKVMKSVATMAACLGLALSTAGPSLAAENKSASVESVAKAAYAAIESSSAPEATYEALSEKQKDAIDQYYLPADETVSFKATPLDATAKQAVAVSGMPTTQGAAIQAGGCWGTYAKRTVNNNFGMGLFDVYVEGSWCSNGSSITSTSFSRTWSTIGVPGWRDSGQIGSGKGISGGEARIWGQRLMQFGTAGWDLIEHRTCVRLNGGKTGWYSVGTVCSIY